MNALRMVTVLAILTLSGCVQMVKVESGQVTIRDTLTVTLDSARNRFEAPGVYLHVASGAHEIWTADGVPLSSWTWLDGEPGVVGGETPVLVEGRLNPDDNGNPRIWNAQDGTPRASFEVTAETVRFLGGAGEGGAAASQDEPALGAPESEDEIPF